MENIFYIYLFNNKDNIEPHPYDSGRYYLLQLKTDMDFPEMWSVNW